MLIISEKCLETAARAAISRCIEGGGRRPGDRSGAAAGDFIAASKTTGAAASVAPFARDLAYLSRALRDERRLGRAGHWSYDLNRHLALAQAYQNERKRLRGKAGPE